MIVPVTDALAIKVPVGFICRQNKRLLCAIHDVLLAVDEAIATSMMTALNSPMISEEGYASTVGSDVFDIVIMPFALDAVLIFKTTYIQQVPQYELKIPSKGP